MELTYGIPLDQWIHLTSSRTAVDTCVVWRTRYFGSEQSGLQASAATSGDLTFKVGDLSSEAGDTSMGTINVSDFGNVGELVNEINVLGSGNGWEAWFQDYPSSWDCEVSAGNSIWAGDAADKQCKIDGGYATVDDTSLETAEVFPVGLTKQEGNNHFHATDHQMLHQILKISCKCDWTANGFLYVLEVDDDARTTRQVDKLDVVDVTATDFGDGSFVLYEARGKRLVCSLSDDAGAITTPTLKIYSRSAKIGPAVRASKTWSHNQ